MNHSFRTSRMVLSGLFCASVLLMGGCASDAVKEEPKASVEDRTPGAVKPPAPTASTTPQQSGGVGVKPLPPQPGGGAATGASALKDPNNILSKRSIFYDYDSDAIKEEFRPMMQAHAKYLSDNRGAKMLIQGNTDEATALVRAAQSALDRAARRNVIHPNAASRRKSRLAQQLKAKQTAVAA